jgi:ABC-type multidrug transport system fused ATPase/permease subunit
MPPLNPPHHLKSGLKFLCDILKKPESRPVPEIRISDLAYFFRFMRPLLKLYLLGIGLTLVVTCLGSVLPLAGKFFVDFVVQKSDTGQAGKLLGPLYPGIVTPGMLARLGSVEFLIAAMLAIGILVGVLGMARSFVLRKFEQELTFNIQTALFDRVLSFPMSYLKNRQTGYLMSRISGDVGAVTALLNQVVNQSLSSLFSLLFSFFIIFALNSKLSIVLLIIIPVTMIVNNFFSRRYRSISRSERESDAQLSRDMQEILSGLEVVKLYNAEEKEARRVSDRMRSLNAIRMKSMLIAGVAQFFSSGAQSLLTMSIMWIGVLEIAGGSMTIGDYLAFTAYSVSIAAAINSVLNLQLSIQPLLASLERLLEMFRVATESEAGASRQPGTRPRDNGGEVEFRDVSFSYDGRQRALDHVSFSASRGDIVALVGPSGSGKTTIVNLLLKFYSPSSGIIFVDGHDIGDLDAGDLRNGISVVTQDIFLFNDTIEHNIKYGNPEASHADVVAAAKHAHIHDEIMSFPDRYATLIGERGSKLSQGQRQRISLSRAFLKNAPLLVLDEPTSSLDTITEALFRDSLRALSKNRTMLIISHRMFVCDMATNILVIHDGRVAESGTHEDLLEKKGYYYELYRAEGKKKAMAPGAMSPAPASA